MSQNLESLLAQKRSIIENIDSYNETVSIPTKHVRRFVLTWKIWYTYHDEVRFNDVRFRKDLADIDVKINACIDSISSEGAKYTTTKIYDLQRESRALDYKTANLQQSLQAKQKETQKLQNVPANLAASQRLKEESQEKFGQLEDKQNELSNEQKGFTAILEKNLQQRDPQTRAEMLAGIFHDEGGELLIPHIIGIGVDISFLGLIAIQKEDKELLLYSIEQGATLDEYIHDGKTLVQHALDSGNTDVISFALESTENFNCTIIGAIKRGDKESLETILTYNSDLVYEVISGYSLIQHMVALGRYDMATSLITSHPNIVNVKNEDGASIFKTALLSKAPLEFFEMFTQYLDIQNELFRLIEQESAYHMLKHAVDIGFMDQEQLDNIYHVYASAQPRPSILEDLELVEYTDELPNQIVGDMDFTYEAYAPYVEVI